MTDPSAVTLSLCCTRLNCGVCVMRCLPKSNLDGACGFPWLVGRTLVFVRTKRVASWVRSQLDKVNIPAEEMHGDRSQVQRPSQ